LVDEPQFLILDEPTNHLDVEMIEQLEKILKKSDMTLLMVTHDRYFLERVCTDIYELDRGVIVCYPGNYQYYLTKKAEREELQARTLHHLKQDYKQELARVRKAPRGRGTKSVARESKFYELQDHYQGNKQDHFDQSKTLSLDIQHRRL
jgi:ATP-binding cassette subfamily F protein uup